MEFYHIWTRDFMIDFFEDCYIQQEEEDDENWTGFCGEHIISGLGHTDTGLICPNTGITD